MNPPNYQAGKGVPQPSAAAISFVASLLVRDPLKRAGCRMALSSEYIRSSTQSTGAARPSSEPSVGHGASKFVPAPDSQAFKGVFSHEDRHASADESTDCESSDGAPAVTSATRCFTTMISL